MKIKKAEHFLRLLLAPSTTSNQALALLKTANDTQAQAIAEIAHNFVHNPHTSVEYVRKRQKLFSTIADKRKQAFMKRHSLVILRALIHGRKVVLQALTE